MAIGAAAAAGQAAIKDRNDEARNMNRRNVVKTLLLGAGSTALLSRPASGAQAASRLDVKDPAAVAQGYTQDAGQVDPKQYPTFVKGSSCENCLLLQGTAGPAYRPCDLFQGKLVAVKGWCKGWAAEL